mmetsp:Transcript_8470/g.15969  ORF Transcript_8470/g.15969 Transcript_8470/m.15969 type:complete len:441 (+) Transcript_8470:188-1510(+)
MYHIQESNSSPHNEELTDATQQHLASRTIDRSRGGGKRRASECLRPHMLRGIYNASDTNQTNEASLSSLRRPENHSMPILSYRSNGLKRNKSNELSHQANQAVGLRRSLPRSASQANATFDHVIKPSESYQLNPVLGSMHSSTLTPNEDSGNATFHMIQRRQNNPFLDRMMNAIHEESSSGNPVSDAPMAMASASMMPLVPNMKAQSTLELDKNTGSVQNTTSANDKSVPQNDSNYDNSLHTSIVAQIAEIHPQTTLITMLQEAGYKAEPRKYSQLHDYFLEYTEEHIAAYDQEVINAIRSRNIPLLRALKANGKTLQCANRYGESLVHMACRRGMTDVVRFLVLEANVTLRVKDDYGRTPLHDACWSAEPNFELMDFLIDQEADLLLIEDKRGHFPFSYARRSHWEGWNIFLFHRKGNICLRVFQELISSDSEKSTIIG